MNGSKKVGILLLACSFTAGLTAKATITMVPKKELVSTSIAAAVSKSLANAAQKANTSPVAALQATARNRKRAVAENAASTQTVDVPDISIFGKKHSGTIKVNLKKQ